MSFKPKSILPLALAALWLLVPALLVPAVSRADYAILANGFRLRVERAETAGSQVKLYIAGGGYVEMNASEVRGFEKEEAASPAEPATVSAKADIPSLIRAAGAEHGVDPALVRSVIAEESGFNARAVSRKGAAGLMQLMPRTAASLGVTDTLDPAHSVHGGTRYLRSLLERYKGDLAKALAAYNAGPPIVDRYRGIPPYAETQNYVRRVITRFNKEKTAK